MSGTEIVKSSLGLENKIYNLDEMVPSQIVGELDKYIIGQAKKKDLINCKYKILIKTLTALIDIVENFNVKK